MTASITLEFRLNIRKKKIFQFFLLPRIVKFYQTNRLRRKRIVQKDLPQELVLSLMLFNLYIKDILYKIPYNYLSIQFADDNNFL